MIKKHYDEILEVLENMNRKDLIKALTESTGHHAAKQIEIWIRRDSSGQIYSSVIDVAQLRPGYEGMCSVVIDRVKGRAMSPDTLKLRAKSIAEILGCDINENYDWPCAAIKKLPCSCPECVKSGC